MSHENCKRKDGNIGCIDCVAYGADEEQSRIIELLENQRTWFVQHNYGDNFIKAFAFQEAIALIEGGK